MTAQFTIVTSQRPATLSKTVRWGADGAVVREGGGLMIEGQAEIVSISSLADLAALLLRLGPAQALAFGVPRGGGGRVVTRAAQSRHGARPGVLTRTRDQFVWPSGSGVLMLDHDADDTVISREELVALVRTASPGLAEAEMLWWPSASSHICDAETERDLTGLRGQRLYLLVREAADIPRAGAALVDRLWAAGHGRVVVSAAGAALERCPVDSSVWQPERLDFAAGAACEAGLVQRRGDPELIAGGVATVDTRTALPDVPTIRREATVARRRARADADEAMDVARERFLDAQILSAQDRDDPAKRDAARVALRGAVDNHLLTAAFRVEVETAPGRFETMTVRRILDDRAGLHGRLTRDPLEPGYGGGRATGKLFLLDSKPTLHSFAHGGRSFRLVRCPRRVEVGQGRLVDATEAALVVLRDDPAVFDFGGQVALAEHGRLLPLDEHALGYHLAGSVQFWQRRKVGGELAEVDIDPPAKLLRQIMSLGARRELKPLSAVVTAPTLRADGSLLAVAGYDPTTTLLVALLEDAGDVSPTPERSEVVAALRKLMHPFGGFPLVDHLARGGLLAALLTAVVRPALATAPAFAMDAPVQGSDKTLLASCIAALATGDAPEIWPHTAGRDDEEIRKRLFTALRDGITALVWDNVTGVFDSAALASAITAPMLRDRVLGRSESLSIPNRALLLLTGNNLCPAGDLPRRIIPIRIDPGTDAPFAREFDLDPLGYVLDHRQELCVAALVLMRGWLSSGAVHAPGRTASFEAWDELVRQTVCWINCEIAPGEYGDPLDLICRAHGGDPEQESLFALLTALEGIFMHDWFTARDVCQHAARGRMDVYAVEQDKMLADALGDFAKDRQSPSSRTVGRILQFREGRIVFGLRLVSRPGRNGRDYRINVIGDGHRCGFGGFGGLNSDHAEIGEAEGTSEGTRPKTPWAETNPANPPNPQIGACDPAGEY